MASASDRARVILVAATAVAQAVTAPVTTWALGPSFNIGPISDANLSPVTPADYAFAVWGLIYAACIALAVYQLLPSQQERTVHRLTGWWLFGAFTASTLWVPVFGTRTLWLAQILIVILVGYLVCAARAFLVLSGRRRRIADTRSRTWPRGVAGAGWGIVIAVVIPAVFFGLSHVTNENATWLSTFNIAIFGLLFGTGYVLTAELALPIGLHFGWDFVQGFVFGVVAE